MSDAGYHLGEVIRFGPPQQCCFTSCGTVATKMGAEVLGLRVVGHWKRGLPKHNATA